MAKEEEARSLVVVRTKPKQPVKPTSVPSDANGGLGRGADGKGANGKLMSPLGDYHLDRTRTTRFEAQTRERLPTWMPTLIFLFIVCGGLFLLGWSCAGREPRERTSAPMPRERTSTPDPGSAAQAP